jgi:hypothetical protein
MNHKAIYALYPQVVSYVEGTGGFDAEGNAVEVNLEAVSAWVDPEEYKAQRASTYPSFADQFDLLYHGGYDAWKETIDAVKQQFPKP